MQITFYGAAREVTGSMHLVANGEDRVLLDCGLFQGRRSESAEKNRVLPFDPRILTNLVLSHAHTDHSGRIPLLTQKGFAGRVVCTRPTHSACTYLLPDSASIQESDAAYLNYKTVRQALTHRAAANQAGMTPEEARALLKKGRHELNTDAIDDLLASLRLDTVRPLYTLKDAEAALSVFEGFPYEHTIEIGREMTCTFYDAGHILGSAISLISERRNGRTTRIGFTGDLGRFGKPILNDPQLTFPDAEREVDLLVMESTYGDRLHEPVADLKGQLLDVLQTALQRGGTVLDPGLRHRAHPGAAVRPARALQRAAAAARADLRRQPAGGSPDPGLRGAPGSATTATPRRPSWRRGRTRSASTRSALRAVGRGVHGPQPGRDAQDHHRRPRGCARPGASCTTCASRSTTSATPF